MEWSVAVEVAGKVVFNEVKDEELDKLVDHLLPHHPSVSGTAEEPTDELGRYGVRLVVKAPSPDKAVSEAISLLTKASMDVGLPEWPVVRVEAIEWGEFERELERPTYPDLLGVSELAELLGVSRHRASELARTTHFPRPTAELASGPVWFETNVQRFVQDWKREPGRPRKMAAAE